MYSGSTQGNPQERHQVDEAEEVEGAGALDAAGAAWVCIGAAGSPPRPALLQSKVRLSGAPYIPSFVFSPSSGMSLQPASLPKPELFAADLDLQGQSLLATSGDALRTSMISFVVRAMHTPSA